MDQTPRRVREEREKRVLERPGGVALSSRLEPENLVVDAITHAEDVIRIETWSSLFWAQLTGSKAALGVR